MISHNTTKHNTTYWPPIAYYTIVPKILYTYYMLLMIRRLMMIKTEMVHLIIQGRIINNDNEDDTANHCVKFGLSVSSLVIEL